MALSFVNSEGAREQVEPHHISAFNRQNKGCDLCDVKVTVHDEVFYAGVYYMFGISYCKEHEELANKAKDSWMHKKSMVAFDMDAKLPKEITVFLTILKHMSKSGGFKVRRTDGTIDNGWHLRKSCWASEPVFIVKSARTGEWMVPTVQPTTHTTRHSSIADFKELTGISPKLIDAVLAVLDAGVYRESHDYVETELKAQLGL